MRENDDSRSTIEGVSRRDLLRKGGFASGGIVLGGIVSMGSSAGKVQGPIDGRLALFDEPPSPSEQFELLSNEGGFDDKGDIHSCLSGDVNEWIIDKEGGYVNENRGFDGNALLLLRSVREFEEGDTLEIVRVGGRCEPNGSAGEMVIIVVEKAN